MTIFQSFFLGALQGVAEFLPVSSSGHLAIAQRLFGLQNTPLIFTVLLHAATLAAVIVFFHRKIGALLAAAGRFIIKKSKENDREKIRLIGVLLCATAITGVFGLFLNDHIPQMPIKFVFCGFLATGILLAAASAFSARGEKKLFARTGENLPENGTCPEQVPVKRNSSSREITFTQGLFVGIAQGIGVIPGISRSGITISASLFAGIDRQSAGEFSFLLSIPAILGAFLLEAKDLDKLISSVSAPALITGCAAAFFSGLLALGLLMKLIRKGRLGWFALYLIPAGLLGLLFF